MVNKISETRNVNKLRKIATKLEGWNLVSDVSKKLNIKKNSAYVYLHKLNTHGFILQKVRRPKGTAYLISSIPIAHKHFGMYEKTDIVAPEIELSKKEVPAEQKVAYFLSLFKRESNVRYFEQAQKFIRNIKSWKLLYRYLKAYKSINEFKKLYIESRKTVRKIPGIPKKYKKLIGIEGKITKRKFR